MFINFFGALRDGDNSHKKPFRGWLAHENSIVYNKNVLLITYYLYTHRM